MTGPKEPGDDEDWGFPEVDPAGPSSTQLPEPEDEAGVAHDTGSDAWWRAQAEAQRRAAANDPVVPPAGPREPEPEPAPETVEPQVLTPVDPLDAQWLPPDLTPAQPAAPVQPEPPTAPAAAEPPVPPAAAAPPAEEPAPPPVEEPAPPPVAPPVEQPLAEPVEPVEPAARRQVARPPAVPLRPTPPPPVSPPAVPPPTVPPAQEPPPVADATDPHGIPPVPPTRPPYDGEKVGPARAVAGAAIALVGVLLGIGALFVLGDDEPKGGPVVALPTTSTAPASVTPSATASATPSAAPVPTPTASSAPTAAAPTAAPAAAPVVPVAVLNNSRVSGLASRAAARFRAGGWPVSTEGNYRGRLASTTVYYDVGQQASAERFAKQFGIPRVLPRSVAPGLPVSGMTVVLTRDYRA